MNHSPFVRVSALLFAHIAGVFGQTYTQSNTSGPLSPSLALAPPSTTYALSGLDRVNYYNGSLSVRIPLTTIGGRGGANTLLSVPISRQWRVEEVYATGSVSYVPTTTMSAHVGLRYTPGYVTQSASSKNPDSCIVTDQSGQQHWAGLGPYLTWLVWHAADGSETVLVDSAYNGQPQSDSIKECTQLSSYQPANRGRTFTAYDGSNLVFVASEDVYDTYLPASNYTLSGTLYFPDGSHYVISGGFSTGMVDRNGNRNIYAFQSTASGGIYTISDSAGRTETITLTEHPPSNNQDVIVYPGSVGRIEVNYDQLQNVLNTGESLKTSKCLFPELDGSSTTQFNPWVISSIVLADDSAYTFRYNSYGEVARISLPTGGAYTYQYRVPASCTDTTGASGVISVSQGAQYSIYRRLIERDELADGATVSAHTVFEATAVPASPNPIDPNHATRSGTKVQVDFKDAANNLVRRELHYFYGDPSSVNSLPVSDTSYPNWSDGIEFKTEIGTASSTLQTQQRVWRQRPCGAGENCWFDDPQAENARPHDPQMCHVNTQLDSTIATNASGVVFGYDQFNNPADVYEFQYGSAPAIGASCPNMATLSGYARHTAMTYKSDSSYVAAGPNLVRLPLSKTVYNGSGGQSAQETWGYDGSPLESASGLAGHDDTQYGTGKTVRGNVTSHQVWYSTGTSPAESYTYDTTGSVLSHSDFNSKTTTFTYSDGAHVSPTQITNALSQTQQFTYSQSTLKPILLTDANSVSTSYTYSDLLDRVTTIKRAVADPAETWTSISYPSATRVSITQDQNAKGDGAIRLDTLFDGFGRKTETRQYENASQYVSATTTYDSLGRVHTAANPSRPGDGLNVSTTYSHDALGRVVSMTTSDGSATLFDYSFDATALKDQAQVTDPAGGVRRHLSDALGRLTQVVEDPSGLNIATTYEYDVLDNRKTVTQNGQTRTYNYDSLGRLTSATTPEGETVSYPSYDGNGNLKQRTSGGVTTDYTYDALNRVTLISYTPATTAAITYCYDGKVFGSSDGNCAAGSAAHSVGRLTQVHTSVSTTSYTAYDALGRVSGSVQKTSGQEDRVFQYVYNLSGALTKETYPSGRTVMNGYDAAGRLCSVGGTTASPPAPPYACTGSGTTIYANSIQYAPQGALKSLTRGDQLSETWNYNSRMQPSGITVGSVFGLNLYYCTGKQASCSNNSGNVIGVTPATPGVDQVASYDKLNRLKSFQEGSNWQNYSYDSPGNRWVFNSGSLPFSSFMPSSSNGYNAQNRLSAGQYADGRGNLTGIGAYTFTYDGENRLATVQIGQGTTTYGYDGFGQRVTKTSGGQTTTYVYDAMGNLAVEYGNATAPCTTCYVSVDQLGSTRVLTDAAGSVKERHDYAPFGDELLAGVGSRTTAQGYLSSGTPPGVSLLFTGQYRDTELASSAMASGLDYFRARHYAPALGRFMQPDPVGSIVADSGNPQSWHLYNYVWNNPLAYVDPTGLDVEQLGNCYWNVTRDPETGRISSATFGGCTPQASGAAPGGSSTTPNSHPNPTVPKAQPCMRPTAVQRAGIAAQGRLAKLLGKTLLMGLGVSGGAGLAKGLGIYGSLSVQIGVSPNGNAGYLISLAAPAAITGAGTYAWLTPSTKGLGWQGGPAFGFSNVSDPSQLAGGAVDVSGSIAAGFGIGADISTSGDTYQANVNFGWGAGGRGSAGALTNTWVIPFCHE